MATESPVSQSSSWLRRVIVGRNPKRTLARTALWVLLCVVVSNFVLVPIKVKGISMMPTYQPNRVNFVNRLAYLFHPPRRGDVVAIKLAGPHVMYLKRVVGLPGETVTFHGGRLFINGEPLDEPYVGYRCDWEHEPIEVGPDEYYVVGDNRSMDFYDHEQGKSSRERILGKTLL